MEQYCEKIPISGNIRLDLFTAVSFRVRISSLNGEPFPEQFEIPFAVGKVTPWEPVPYEADHVSDSTMVVVKTAKIVVYVRKDTGTFLVEDLEGRRLYPETAQQYGMFKNHCIVFDSANFWREETDCSRYAHWFYNYSTRAYDILLKEDALLDTFFIYGETYRKGYALFNQLVGAEPMLPKKGYGYYQTQHLGAEGSQTLFLQMAQLLRERDIPCDTLILDLEWGDGAAGGKEVPWGSRLEWSPEYSEPLTPGEMIAKLKEMYFDVMTIHHSIPDYAGRMDEGWVCQPYPHDAWWEKMQEQLSIGVAGTWQDTRQNDVTNARVYTELEMRTGKRVTMLSDYDLYRDSCWTKDCVMTPKKQKIGGRRTPFYWTGDSRVKTWEDLAFQIRGIVNEHGALKGISYLTNDGFRPGGRELSARSDAFLAFNSVARSHNHKPWQSETGEELAERMAIGKEQEEHGEKSSSSEQLLGIDCPDTVQESIVRKFLKIRYNLLPYLYSAARECYDTGLPITRPLMVAFEEDGNCNRNQYPMQYMFGPDILVCPVWHEGDRMEVYLPAGCDWVDFFTGKLYAGGQKMSVDVSDLASMPVFVRNGAVIPMRREKNWIDGEEEEVVLKIFGKGDGECILYEDDGVSLAYRTGEYSLTKIISHASETGAEIVVEPVQGKFSGMSGERKITAEHCGKTAEVVQKKDQKIRLVLK